MKRWILFSATLALLTACFGCGDGMASSQRERQERYRKIADHDMRELLDDIDSFLLADRPSHLSTWRTR